MPQPTVIAPCPSPRAPANSRANSADSSRPQGGQPAISYAPQTGSPGVGRRLVWPLGVALFLLAILPLVHTDPLAAAEVPAPRAQPDPSAPPNRVVRILVIDEEGATRPAFVQTMEGFRRGLAEAPNARYEVFHENLELTRLERRAEDVAAATGWLLGKYQDITFDYVLTTSRLTQAFVATHRDRLAPHGRHIAFIRGGDEGGPHHDPTNPLLKVTSDSPMGPTIHLALQLFPGARRIVLIGQRHPHPGSMALTDQTLRKFARERGLEYTPLIDLPLPELRTQLQHLPSDSIGLFYGYWKDEQGRAHVPAELLETLTRDSPAPLFGPVDTYVGRGVVGGVCADLAAIGLAAGRQVVASSNGQTPEPIHVPLVTLLDQRALTRFEVSPALLPPGSRVIHQEPRLWSRYWPHLLLGATLVVLQSGLILGLISQLRLRRRAEQVVHEQQEQLHHVSRVSTLGQYAASLTHELGQPLGSMLNNLEVVEQLLKRDDSAVADELREIVADLIADDRRAGAVLDGIRALVRKQRFTRGAVEVPRLLRSVLTLADPRLRSQAIEVQVHCPPGIPPVAGDEILLQQALLNLLANSADAIRDSEPGPPRKGNTAAGRRETHTITLRAQRQAEWVELAVIDRGGGVVESVVHKMLEPFVTTKCEGLGMGLAIVRSIVEQHEGELQVVNEPGRGLTVGLRLPVWKPE